MLLVKCVFCISHRNRIVAGKLQLASFENENECKFFGCNKIKISVITGKQFCC